MGELHITLFVSSGGAWPFLLSSFAIAHCNNYPLKILTLFALLSHWHREFSWWLCLQAISLLVHCVDKMTRTWWAGGPPLLSHTGWRPAHDKESDIGVRGK